MATCLPTRYSPITTVSIISSSSSSSSYSFSSPFISSSPGATTAGEAWAEVSEEEGEEEGGEEERGSKMWSDTNINQTFWVFVVFLSLVFVVVVRWDWDLSDL